MKFSISVLVLLVATAVAAFTTSEREYTSYVVSFEDGTPDSVVDEAIAMAKKNGVVITHRYHIIQGFSCDSPDGAEALTFMTANDYEYKEYKPCVEEDKVVTTQHKKKSRSG